MVDLEATRWMSAHLRRIRRDEYVRMAEMGMFEDERVELVDGMVLVMAPQSPKHAAVVRRLMRLFYAALSGRADISGHSPFAIGDVSMPEPDVAVIPSGLSDDAYPTRAYIVIEVALTSLAFDRGRKAALYAAAGIPEYWIVNLVDQVIEVHREPGHDGYGRVQERRRGDAVQLAAFPDVNLDVGEVLGS